LQNFKLERIGQENMFSPDMMRYVIDPDNLTEEKDENHQTSPIKNVYSYNSINSQKILSDFSFFAKFFGSFGRILAVETGKKI